MFEKGHYSEEAPETLINVFDCAPEKLHQLQEQVLGCGGKLAILVHPFFGSSEQEYAPEYMATLASSSEDGVPAIVFEEQYRMSELRTRLENAHIDEAFVVPTRSNDPTPLVNDSDESYNRDNNWQKLLLLLSEIGVKEIQLSGSQLSFYAYDEITHTTGCLGYALMELCPHFSVTVSENTVDAFGNPAEFDAKLEQYLAEQNALRGIDSKLTREQLLLLMSENYKNSK